MRQVQLKIFNQGFEFCLFLAFGVDNGLGCAGDKVLVRKLPDLCLQLLSQTPVYLLECLPQESAALLTKKGLGL